MGHYEEALSLTNELLEDAEKFRLAFVVPYALTSQALIRCGVREYLHSAQLLDDAEEHALRSGDQTAYHIAWAVRTRVYTAQGEFQLATKRAIPRDCGQTRSLEAELLASYAVAFAGKGELARARVYAARAQSMSQAVETAISAPCALAMAAVREGDQETALSHATAALQVATRCGMIEAFVSAYRGCPEIIVALLTDPGVHDDLNRVLAMARDEPKGAPDLSAGSISSLSRREKEVLGLLAQGLSNPEIGQRLFISPTTVKVHVRHIFEKLGVRSRAEAALRAAQLDRG
jgi:DNA-binding NarL/FixJ family response regulator